LQLNGQYPKLTPQTQQEIINYLMEKHLKEKADPKKEAASIFKKYDFLIIKHLIPEQFIIYPLMNFLNNNELVFRFPGHKKKVQLYITNHTKRFENNPKKIRRNCINKELFPFINFYLDSLDNSKKSECLFFTRKLPRDDWKAFQESMDSFFISNKNNFNYPNDHL